MVDSRVFLKTFRGVEAVKTRAQNLTVEQRYLLLQIDGNREVSEILESTAELGDFSGVFSELESLGFVTRVSFGADTAEASPAPRAEGPVPATAPPPPVQGAAPAAAAAKAPSRRPLAPTAPPDDVLREAAVRVLYTALGPEADRFVLRIQRVKRNDELVAQLERDVQSLAGLGRSMSAGDLQELLSGVELRAPAPSAAQRPASASSHPRDLKKVRESLGEIIYRGLGPEGETMVFAVEKARTPAELVAAAERAGTLLRTIGKADLAASIDSLVKGLQSA